VWTILRFRPIAVMFGGLGHRGCAARRCFAAFWHLLYDGRTTFLRWEGTMDGHKIESLEVIVDNEQGLVVERTIALRPHPAVKLFRDAMFASLKDKLPPVCKTSSELMP